VLQWITEHGEAFLAKYTGIGKTLPRATQLRKRHEDFEDVAQNTYTNAEKLLEAAEQLAQNGDCDPHEIFQVAALYLLSSRGAGTPPPVEFQRFAASSCEYISQKWVFALLFRCFSGSGEIVVRNDITFCDGTTTTLNQTMKVSKNWFVVEKKQTFHVPLEKVTKICSRAFVAKNHVSLKRGAQSKKTTFCKNLPSSSSKKSNYIETICRLVPALGELQRLP